MSRFAQTVCLHDPGALMSIALETLQVNVGLRCNMSCSHCHQASSPLRTEAMSDDVLGAVVAFAARARPSLVDVTGGAPELHPRIRGLISQLANAGLDVQVRTNLTALLEPECSGMSEFFAEKGVQLLASLPAFEADGYERQRGGAFARALEALRHLNALGYGNEPGPRLVLAVNPDAAVLPGTAHLDRDHWRTELTDRYGVSFSDAVLIQNMPLGRLGLQLSPAEARALISTAEREFSADTLALLGCRRGIEIAWDGTFADCDFNLAAGIGLASESQDLPSSVTQLMNLARTAPSEFERALAALIRRRVNFAEHCYICTASCGSS